METVGLGLYLHMAPPPYCYRCPFGLTYPLCALASVKNLETTILGERPETVAEVIVEPIISGVGVAVPPDEYLPGWRVFARNTGCSCTSTRSLTGSAELARCSDISIVMCPQTLLASPKESRARICRSLQRWSKIISFSRSTASPGKPAGGAGKHLWQTPRRRSSGAAQYRDFARGEPRRTTRRDGTVSDRWASHADAPSLGRRCMRQGSAR
jgi:hypothetical protein